MFEDNKRYSIETDFQSFDEILYRYYFDRTLIYNCFQKTIKINPFDSKSLLLDSYKFSQIFML